MGQKLDYALLDNINIKTDWGNALITKKELGNLNLPTGKIICSDPFVFDNNKPFKDFVLPGIYKTYISIAKFGNNERIAYATILFKEDNIVKWNLAIVDGQDITKLKDNEFFGYAVDSGTGCFIDEFTAKIFLEKLNDYDYDYIENIMKLMSESYTHTRSYINYNIEGQMNLIAFSSGLGDGVYPSYFGINDKNEICCLVTDFCILN